MSKPLAFLGPDELVRQVPNNIIEVVSQSADEDLTGVGWSPFVGDIGAPGIRVPEAATASLETGPQPQSLRYLFRLCGVEIPSGYGVVLRGIRQAITLRSCAVVADGDEEFANTIRVFEFEQKSPFWSFPDGNVSWHVRWVRGLNSPRAFDPAQRPGTSPSLQGQGMDSVLLYNQSVAAGYIPPGGGIPPGNSVAHLGTLRDLRYPWENTDWTLSVPVMGPGQLMFFASVLQTDPTTRGATPFVSDSIRPEDQFVRDFPNAIYGRVSGALAIEMFPCGGKPQ